MAWRPDLPARLLGARMASVTCPDCTRAASTWNWHGYRVACADCQIRAIAQAPRHLREIRYDQIRRSLGEADAQTLIARVREEHARIKALKGPQC